MLNPCKTIKVIGKYQSTKIQMLGKLLSNKGF